jgi:hypothetical protein
MVQELSYPDFAVRKHFCEQFLALIDEQPDVVQRQIMSDDVYFELSGFVNRQNMQYWSDNNPHRLHGKPLHSERVTVWCRISTVGIIGPYFFRG